MIKYYDLHLYYDHCLYSKVTRVGLMTYVGCSFSRSMTSFVDAWEGESLNLYSLSILIEIFGTTLGIEST